MAAKTKQGSEHFASAKALNLSISTKHSVEISKSLRYKNTSYAKDFLANVIAKKKAVPFKTHRKDVGHKRGMAAGRYPQKAAKEFLSLVNSVEANAQMKGLNTGNLKITKLLANKASTPFTGGRQRRGTKRTHIEIVVKERKGKDKAQKKASKADTTPATKAKEPAKVEQKVAQKVEQKVEKKGEQNVARQDKKQDNKQEGQIETPIEKEPVAPEGKPAQAEAKESQTNTGQAENAAKIEAKNPGDASSKEEST